MVSLFQRRLFCTQSSAIAHQVHRHPWRIRQVTKSNFADVLHDFKSHISTSDFVAVSLQKTGSFSAPWHRVSAFDTPDTAYLKAKYAADRFQIFQFAVCPFSIRNTKVTAYPYNFHLFPRDELKLGMPSYSFSCQTSNLTSMAREGFDFNTCIYDGISYLSRAQECAAKAHMGNPVLANDVKFTSASSTSDKIFIERTKTRVRRWKNSCKVSGTTVDDAMLKSLKQLLLQTEEYLARPCMNIDVCSERQVELVLEMLQEFGDEVVPLLIPAKDGQTLAVRVVSTNSKEDKDILKREIQDLVDEHNRNIWGFREVIDLISDSQKPIISHNSLNDLTFVHSKFLAPLPPSMEEFVSSLRSTFPLVIDVNHLMKEIGAVRKAVNIPTAISYLKNRFFAPMDLEISWQATISDTKIHGHNAVRISELFAKLCYILKVIPINLEPDNKNASSTLEAYANIFGPFSSASQEPLDEDVKIWAKNTRKVNCDDLVYLWGFNNGIIASKLKSLLQDCHEVFSGEFDVRLVDKGCAIVVFWQPGLSRTFLEVMNGGSEISGALREMVSEGLRAAGYGTYIMACRLGLWEGSLADSLDKALVYSSKGNPETNSSGYSELMINLDEL